MESCTGRPKLLVDVDGVLSLFGFPGAPPAGLMPIAVEGIPHFLAPHAGRLLVRLAASFECVWCTGWEERAEEHLPRLLDLPGGWPHLRFGEPVEKATRHWKLSAIEAHARPEEPVAWVDDEHDATCEAWAAERPGPTLLVRTEPSVGLLPEHVTLLESWAARPTG